MTALTIFRIVTAVICPVLLANIFYLIDTRTKFCKLSVNTKQIIIGIVFGGFACLATQFGVQYDDYVLNVRSALPLTAGLVFGGPAGIIAGVIGALYRWFSVYWGVSEYTKVACSLATLFAGVVAALCRKFLFSNKKTSWLYGTFIAVATEVFHMLLVFVTHPEDPTRAFNIVSHTAIVMISTNAVSVLLSLLFVAKMSKEKIHKSKLTRPMTQIFSVCLLIDIILSFVLSCFFTSKLQNNIANLEIENLFKINITDVANDIRTAIDDDLLSRTEDIADGLERKAATLTDEELNDYLAECLDTYNVSEINIVGSDGTVKYSTTPAYVGYDMRSGTQSSEFICLLDGRTDTYVQAYGPVSYDSSIYRKYAGKVLSDGGFVQVAYDPEHVSDTANEIVSDAATYRHIGQTGFIFIISNTTKEVVSAPEGTVTTASVAPYINNLAAAGDTSEDEVTVATTGDTDMPYLYATMCVNGYTVIGLMPKEEAEASRNMSVYISALLMIMVFFILFVVVYILIKKVIIDNIHKVNESLARITGGDLSTKVDIYESEEFSSLSDDINATVDRLKGFISDAEKRIDQELAFAKSIQHSVLPSVFPPYPDREDFDIYATMDTAKEVGGDFYDFYLLDGTHLIFLIADVSGKGIPAAMFMMNAKSVIKNLAESGLSVADVFTQANGQLCATNEAEMFVTSWIGLIDLKTGVVKFANAGHNPPLVRHEGGQFEYLRSRPGLVLAGMEGIRYRENEFTLSPGDEIFLYTDGVTEATNKESELFGEDRLANVLNGTQFESAEQVCAGVKAALDEFVGEADQFDDITMLSFRYLKKDSDMIKLTVPAVVDSINTATDFIDRVLEGAGSTPKAVMQINVAVDEILSNIVRYAYRDKTGEAEIGIRIADGVAVISFTDSGIPFNPLERDDPDVTASAEDRAIGGLGIFMVKKTMDNVTYDFKNGRNILKITKHI